MSHIFVYSACTNGGMYVSDSSNTVPSNIYSLLLNGSVYLIGSMVNNYNSTGLAVQQGTNAIFCGGQDINGIPSTFAINTTNNGYATLIGNSNQFQPSLTIGDMKFNSGDSLQIFATVADYVNGVTWLETIDSTTGIATIAVVGETSSFPMCVPLTYLSDGVTLTSAYGTQSFYGYGFSTYTDGVAGSTYTYNSYVLSNDVADNCRNSYALNVGFELLSFTELYGGQYYGILHCTDFYFGTYFEYWFVSVNFNAGLVTPLYQFTINATAILAVSPTCSNGYTCSTDNSTNICNCPIIPQTQDSYCNIVSCSAFSLVTCSTQNPSQLGIISISNGMEMSSTIGPISGTSQCTGMDVQLSTSTLYMLTFNGGVPSLNLVNTTTVTATYEFSTPSTCGGGYNTQFPPDMKIHPIQQDLLYISMITIGGSCLQIYNLTTDALLSSFTLSDRVRGIVFSLDGTLLYGTVLNLNNPQQNFLVIIDQTNGNFDYPFMSSGSPVPMYIENDQICVPNDGMSGSGSGSGTFNGFEANFVVFAAPFNQRTYGIYTCTYTQIPNQYNFAFLAQFNFANNSVSLFLSDPNLLDVTGLAINPSSYSLCQNGGYCESNSTCFCEPGFSGVFCQIEQQSCVGQCLNGAECVSQGPFEFTCVCVPGYVGTLCETEIDECASYPCSNGGLCTNYLNSYACTCTVGYSGINCQTLIDNCASSPCQNGATCIDYENGFTCNCIYGYTGILCDTLTNLCAISQQVALLLNINSNSVYTIDTTLQFVSGQFGASSAEILVANPVYPLVYLVPPSSTIITVYNTTSNVIVSVTSAVQVITTLTVSNNGLYVYALNDNSNTMFVFDALLFMQIGSLITVGSFPQTTVQNDNGTILYVANYLGNSISVLETPSNVVINTISLPGVNPNGLVLYGSILYTMDLNPHIVGINLTNANAIFYIAIPISTPDGTGLLFQSTVTMSMYVMNSNGQVVTIDLSTQQVVGTTLSLGQSGFENAEMSPDGQYIYAVAGFQSPTVYVLDVLTSISNSINSLPSGFLGVTFAYLPQSIAPSCYNNGTCIPLPNSYSCTCQPGYSGVVCQTEIDNCASQPCQNGAPCVEQVNGYTCTCSAGYSGLQCQYSPCVSMPCMNGATCVVQPTSFSCTCIHGYSGLMCQTQIDECGSNPCKNGGTCTDHLNSYTCACVIGYSGTQCQTLVNTCASVPCVNGATCNDLVNSYTCTCLNGYSGIQCQTIVNNCASLPCANGGTCNNLINSYTCTCITGYSGLQCQTVVNDCASIPCKNGGTCTALLNSYTCTCLSGYSGTQCQTIINNCASIPCANGGTCVNLVNSYVCECLFVYNGTNCQTLVNVCQQPQTLIYVANYQDETISLINEYGNVVQSPPLYIGGGIEAMSLDPLNSLLFAVTQTSVILLNVTTNTIFTTLTSGYAFDVAFGIAIAPALQKFYVLNDASSRISVILMFPFTLHKSILALDTDTLYSIAIIPNNTQVWIGGATAVYVLNTTSDTLMKTISGFSAVYSLAPTFDGLFVVAANAGANNVIFVSTITFTITKTLSSITVYYVVASPLYIAASTPTTSVIIISLATQSVVANITGFNVPSPGVFTSDGLALYIPNYNSANVGLIQLSTLTLINTTINVGNTPIVAVSVTSSAVIGPCFSGGTCMEGINGNTSCACPFGYFGAYCQFIDNCASSPCPNGIACINLIGSYYCQCNAGFSGAMCQTPINYCASHPCINGTCTNNVNGYSCNCSSGFTGTYCEVLDVCISTPSTCPNNSLCTQQTTLCNSTIVIPSTTMTSPASPNIINFGGFTTVQTRALFGGGSISGVLSSSVFIYDLLTGVWTTSTLSVPRDDLVATSTTYLALFAGGDYVSGEVVFSNVDIYEYNSGSWSTAFLSVARRFLAATTIGGTLCLFGGGDNVYTSMYYNTVDLYNSLTNSWSTATLSVGRTSLAAASISTIAMFGGGATNNVGGVSAAVDIYNSTSNSWSTALLSVARSSLTAVGCGNQIFFAGGVTTVVSSVIDIYSLTTNTWTTSTLTVARELLSSTCLGVYAIFGGGGDGHFPYEIYNTATQTFVNTGTAGTLVLNDAVATSVGNLAIFWGSQLTLRVFKASENCTQTVNCPCLTGYSGT